MRLLLRDCYSRRYDSCRARSQSSTKLKFELKTANDALEKERNEHETLRKTLELRNKKYASIEGAKSEAMKGGIFAASVSLRFQTCANLPISTCERDK